MERRLYCPANKQRPSGLRPPTGPLCNGWPCQISTKLLQIVADRRQWKHHTNCCPFGQGCSYGIPEPWFPYLEVFHRPDPLHNFLQYMCGKGFISNYTSSLSLFLVSRRWWLDGVIIGWPKIPSLSSSFFSNHSKYKFLYYSHLPLLC